MIIANNLPILERQLEMLAYVRLCRIPAFDEEHVPIVNRDDNELSHHKIAETQIPKKNRLQI